MTKTYCVLGGGGSFGLLTSKYLLDHAKPKKVVSIGRNPPKPRALSLGVGVGLFLGKQTGILASVFLAKRAGIAALPAGATRRQIYGVALLCGIGFTMSLFIGLLAFSDPEREAATKLAVLVGSLLSALAGAAVLLTGRSPRRVSGSAA